MGVPLHLQDPTGVASDAQGNTWIAHSLTVGGPANDFAVYSASGT